jgi:dihydrofolate synthase/folylpolyglutamate synthase
MRRLSAALGSPQESFDSIHVVGTNGKSSVTRMTAALLGAHGLRTAAYVSPHPRRWSERALIEGEELDAARFAAAVERAAAAAEEVNRELQEGETVTQFELATAAAFLAFAEAGVEAAVIEAGLGGRLDATNTIPSRVTALTSVGLDHTQWLGGTEEEIAAEKLAVLREGSTLVIGRLEAGIEALAEQTARQRGARLLRAPADPGEDVHLRAPGLFQRRNFALARTAAEAFLGRLDPGRVEEVAATLVVPGRLEKIAGEPPVYIDAAHNPEGARALAEAVADIAGPEHGGHEGEPDPSRPARGALRPRVVACLAILRDKDAEGMIVALAPVLDQAICSELDAEALAHRGVPGAASQPAAELARICEAAGLPAEAEPSFSAALKRGRRLAAAEPPGMLVVAGSHYALAPARAELGLCED